MIIRAVLFDLDGTLRDTQDTIYAAVKHAVKVHGSLDLTDKDLAEYMHHHSHVHQRFTPQVSLAEFEEIFHAKLYELLPNVELYTHAVEVLAALHSNGLKLGIVSSARPDEINRFLKKAGIAEYIDAIAGDDGVLPRKPSPEPVLAALKELGVSAGQAAMVGDMRVDMQAADAAQVGVKIGITHGFESGELLTGAGAEYLIDSLDALPELLSKIE